MLKISIYLKEEENQEIIGIKEDFAAYCEKFGDVVRVDVEEADGEQQCLFMQRRMNI